LKPENLSEPGRHFAFQAKGDSRFPFGQKIETPAGTGA
jgi:hypothetical protein